MRDRRGILHAERAQPRVWEHYYRAETLTGVPLSGCRPLMFREHQLLIREACGIEETRAEQHAARTQHGAAARVGATRAGHRFASTAGVTPPLLVLQGVNI